MKQLYRFFYIALWCFIGVFLGSTLYQIYDYNAHPDLYALQSAPWYLSILVRGAMTVIVAALLLIGMAIVKKKMKAQ